MYIISNEVVHYCLQALNFLYLNKGSNAQKIIINARLLFDNAR